MPTSPAQLFNLHGMTIADSVAWGNRPRSDDRGVYVVSLQRDVRSAVGLRSPLIEEALVAAWIQTASKLTVDGQPATVATLTSRLREYWLSDEAILYIGKATTLSSRVGSYYGSKIGRRSPHRGGLWLKALGNLTSLWVHMPRPQPLIRSLASQIYCDRSLRASLRNPAAHTRTVTVRHRCRSPTSIGSQAEASSSGRTA